MSNAAKFIPEIWHLPGITAPILVCGSRFFHGDKIKGSKAGHFTFISHAIAIQLEPFGVITGFTDNDPDRVWTIQPPEDFGISRRAAELALEKAWSIVGKKPYFDLVTRSLKLEVSPSKLTEYREGSIIRDIVVWTHWDRWNRDHLTKKQRVDILTIGGFICTEKALEILYERAGMSIL